MQVSDTRRAGAPSQNLHPERSCGRSSPIGATPIDGGVNFSVYSRDASSVDLLFFDSEEDAKPAHVFALDPFINRTYHYWHLFVPGAKTGQIYGYRVHGPCNPSQGLRF